ncbi:MAG: M48 family metalloprotease [Geminicoccaceae bacterium]
MLEVWLMVNVEGGTILVDNAMIAARVLGRKLERRKRILGVFRKSRGHLLGAMFGMIGVLTLTAAMPAHAQRGVNLIRDAEIETTLRNMTDPLLEAAGIAPAAVNLYIVQDRTLNAFVAGGQNLFINTGLLMRTEHPGQIAGVIAHEIGHIAGGHLSRVGRAQSRAAAEVILSTVLGAAAAVAGAPALGTAIITGGQTYAQGEFLSFSRSQEQSADQAGVSYLRRINVSPAGLAEFFHILEEQNLLSTSRSNPYARSHPLTRDRIRFVSDQVRLVEASSGAQTAGQSDKGYPISWEGAHERMVVKLKAFLGDPNRTLAHYQGDELSDRYARAIAYYRVPDLEKAVAEVDDLIADYVDDPYFHELKGQMLFENGRIEAAIAPYQEAVRLKPTALLRIGLARALMETGRSDAGFAAIRELNAAVRDEPTNAGAWRLLGIAQGRAGEEGEASLSLAEWALLTGKRDDAKLHARRAENRIGPSDPGWLQLQDILRVIEES